MNFDAYAWPGGYPYVYIGEEGETLCATCAKEEHDEQGTIFQQEIYWEGELIECAACNTPIESAYGDPCATESNEAA